MTNTIYTTTDEIQTALNILGNARGHIQAGKPLDVIEAELVDLGDYLASLILRAERADAELQRRETEYQTTGTVTFPSNAA